MSKDKSEHRINVARGKYTFVVPADDYRVSILRYGEPWHGPQSEASNALHSIMFELDAARVVVQAARQCVEALGAPRHVPAGLVDALALHDRLTGDREPPSPWCGPAATGPDRAGADARPERQGGEGGESGAGVTFRALLQSLQKFVADHREHEALDQPVVLRVEDGEDEVHVGGLRGLSVDAGCCDVAALVLDADRSPGRETNQGTNDSVKIEDLRQGGFCVKCGVDVLFAGTEEICPRCGLHTVVSQ